MSPRTQYGIVRWFNDAKGFGFIGPDDSERDLFVHYSNIRGKGHRTLTEGERVSFTAELAEKGPQAINVVRLDPPPEE